MLTPFLADAAAQPAALSDQVYGLLAALVIPAVTALLTVALHHLSVWAAGKFPWLKSVPLPTVQDSTTAPK